MSVGLVPIAARETTDPVECKDDNVTSGCGSSSRSVRARGVPERVKAPQPPARGVSILSKESPATPIAASAGLSRPGKARPLV
jgi:hypothetical protein